MEYRKHYSLLLLGRNPGQSIYVGEHLKISYESINTETNVIHLQALYKNLKEAPLSGGHMYIRDHSKFELFHIHLDLENDIEILKNVRMFYHSRSPGGRQVILGFDAPSSVGIWRDNVKNRTPKWERDMHEVAPSSYVF